MKDPVYRNLFAAAFTDGKINSENMLKALSPVYGNDDHQIQI
jgi:hypothetical protein